MFAPWGLRRVSRTHAHRHDRILSAADECVSNPVPEVLSLGSPAASRASRLALSCATDATEVISCWSTRTRHRQARRLPQDGRDHQRSDERPMVGAVIAEQKPVHECSRNHGHQDQKSDRPNREKWLRHIVEVPADSSHGGLLPRTIRNSPFASSSAGQRT